jgi:hypothetical protein
VARPRRDGEAAPRDGWGYTPETDDPFAPLELPESDEPDEPDEPPMLGQLPECDRAVPECDAAGIT